MAILFKDRQSKYPGRYRVKWENGEIEYITLTRADQPNEEGTPLIAATFNDFRAELKPYILDLTYESQTRVVSGTYDAIHEAYSENRPIYVRDVADGNALLSLVGFVDAYEDYSEGYFFSRIFNGVETHLILVHGEGSSLIVHEYSKASYQGGEAGEDGTSIYTVNNPNNSFTIDVVQINKPEGKDIHVFDLLIDVSTGVLWRVSGMSATGLINIVRLGSMSGSDGEDGTSGLAIYPFEQYTTPHTWVEPSRITIPEGREIQVGDLLIETNTYTLYRVSQMVDESITGSYIGTEKLCDFPISVFQSYADKKLANALMKTVEGENIVSLTDVSPLSHDISLELTSDTDTKVTLNVIGKNILDPPWANGDPYTTQGVTFDTQDDGSVTITGTATEHTPFLVESSMELLTGTYTYRLFGSAKDFVLGIVSLVNKETGEWVKNIGVDEGDGISFTVTDSDLENYRYRLNIRVVSGNKLNGERFCPMLVCGDKVPTEYEPYVLYEFVETKPSLTPITLSSHEPDMTIFAATSGVTLKATYNRDLAKVIGRIETALGL